MSDYSCKPGDVVVHKGKKVSVSVVLVRGSAPKCWTNNYGHTVNVKGKKATISVCRIMPNGQILKRSPFFIGDKWEHVS